MTEESTAGHGQRPLLGGLAFFCLIAGAFFLPFGPLVPGPAESFPGIRVWDWQRLFQAVFVGLGLTLAALNVAAARFRFPFSAHVLWAWAAIAGLTLMSAAMAHYPQAALLDWAWMHGLVVLAVFAAWLFSPADRRWEDYWLASAGIAIVLYTFWFFVTNSDVLFSFDFRDVATSFPGFGNLRYFSDFQSVLLFLGPLAVQRYLRGGAGQALGWLMIGLFYMLAFVAGSRSILAGQLVAHGLLFAACGRGYLRQFRSYLLCWLSGFVLYYLIIVAYAPWSVSLGAPAQENAAASAAGIPAVSLSVRYDSSARGELLEKSRRLIADAPWLGIGGRHYGCFLKKDFRDPYNKDNGDAAHPHNAFLQLAVEWGMPVAVTVSFGVAWLLFRVGRRLRREAGGTGDLSAALLGGLLALLVHAMVTGVLNGPTSQMQLVVLLGWCLSLVSVKSFPLRPGPPAAALTLVWVGLILCVGMLFINEAMDLLASVTSRELPTWYLAPRFWQQGWLLPLCGKV